MKIFGVEISFVATEDLHDGLAYDDADQQEMIEYANEYMVTQEEDGIEYESYYQGYYAPPRHRWWQR